MITKEKRAGHCYHVAFMAITAPHIVGNDVENIHVIAEQLHQPLLLVHGYPRRYGDPSAPRMGHAWLEVGGMVYSLAQMMIFPRGDFYRVGHIREKHCRRYTAKQALAMAARHGTSGPWEQVDVGEQVLFADDHHEQPEQEHGL